MDHPCWTSDGVVVRFLVTQAEIFNESTFLSSLALGLTDGQTIIITLVALEKIHGEFIP